MTSIISKFSPGDRAYYPIYAIAEIKAVSVINVFIDDGGSIFYDVDQSLPTFSSDYTIPESELFTFSEAKTNLLTWLNAQIIKVTNISGI